MPSQTPFRVETAALQPPGPLHLAVDARKLVGDVVDRWTITACQGNRMMIRRATNEIHHICRVTELETQKVDKEQRLLLYNADVQHHMRDLGRLGRVDSGHLGSPNIQRTIEDNTH